MTRWVSRREAAEDLRDQAQNCREIAGRARTSIGAEALAAMSRFLDEDARRTDPASERRS